MRGVALCAIAAVALLAACEATVPTDGTVAALDAAKAKQAAQLLGAARDSVVYIVDGKPVSFGDAEKLKADDIFRTKIQKGGRAMHLIADTIEIDTKAAADGRAATLAERKARGYATLKLDSVKVARPAAGYTTKLDSANATAQANADAKRTLEEFTGLVFIDGVEVPASRLKELAKLSISSVEVLKGVAAEKAYGERAKAGVIKIITKQ